MFLEIFSQTIYRQMKLKHDLALFCIIQRIQVVYVCSSRIGHFGQFQNWTDSEHILALQEHKIKNVQFSNVTPCKP